MKLYWFNKHCCVPECSNTSTEGDGCFKEYFDLPAEPQARTKWLTAILTEDSDDLKVCEDHFKEEDVFRDKNNRKKLRLNSVPSVKLPQDVCNTCLGSINPIPDPRGFEPRICQCIQNSTALQPMQQLSSGNKRTRITWTAEEKRTIFKAIKNHGDVRVGNTNIRINWTNVVNICRANGCFGNEKEMKTVWQHMRANATKVYRNEIFGSRLERKVSRFLYGKPPKKNRGNRVTISDSTGQTMDTGSTDEDEEYRPRQFMIQELLNEDDEEMNGAIMERNGVGQDNYAGQNDECGYVGDAASKQVAGKACDVEKVADGDMEEVDDDESDEYYSISDVEAIFQISIRPKPPKKPEIISLLSSDDEE